MGVLAWLGPREVGRIGEVGAPVGAMGKVKTTAWGGIHSEGGKAASSCVNLAKGKVDS